jgi:methyl-accepting chemotaxis protein
MDQMTQQNAAMVEETTAASQVLAAEAAQLQTALSQFHIDTGRSHTAPQRRAA